MSPVICPCRSGLHQTCPFGPERKLTEFVDGRVVVPLYLVGERQVGGIEDARFGAEEA